MLKISDFTSPELDYFSAVCNFTPDEQWLFDLRREHKSLEDCAEIMSLSGATISRIHQKILSKIEREM